MTPARRSSRGGGKCESYPGATGWPVIAAAVRANGRARCDARDARRERAVEDVGDDAVRAGVGARAAMTRARVRDGRDGLLTGRARG